MFIDFEKWHGTKNDFIVCWILAPDKDLIAPTLSRLAPRLCQRDGSGIGADGILLLITKSKKDSYPDELIIINADGSAAKNCGNGLRCAAMSARRRAHQEGLYDFDGITLKVQDTSIDCRFIGASAQPLVAVTMPIPNFGQVNEWSNEVQSLTKQLQTAHPQLRGDLETVDLGNPHIVITVEDATAELAELAGRPLQVVRNRDGINVHVASPKSIAETDQQRARLEIGEEISELFKVYPWERGVGPTQACGTGACAVGVAAWATGLTERSMWVGIDMPGGRLYVKQDEPTSPVTLAGPATFVFQGNVEI
jgi:diaminopimelate epimerase